MLPTRYFRLLVPALLLVAPVMAQDRAHKDERPRIAVLDFPVAEGAWEGWGPGGWHAGERRISSAIQELMITELMDAGRGQIRLIDRQRLQEVIAEQKLTNSGLVDDSHAIQLGKLAGVKYMVTGKVTRFAYKKSGISTGWGVKALADKVLPKGGLLNSAAGDVDIKKASFTGRLDVRVIDVQTGEIIAVVKDEGKTENVGVKVAGTGNDIEWDQELVNKIFEPVCKTIAGKLVGRIVRD